jgi:hypothetical protein
MNIYPITEILGPKTSVCIPLGQAVDRSGLIEITIFWKIICLPYKHLQVIIVNGDNPSREIIAREIICHDNP